MVEEFYFKSSTGRNLHAKKWYDESLNTYKGIVQLVHGMEEFIDRYDNFAEFLSHNGYLVVGHDHLGHGKSVRNEKDLGDYDCENGWLRLTEDIHILQNKIQNEYPNIPYIIFGHSMGSLLVRTYITIYKDNISKVILCGTSGQKNKLYAGLCLANIIKIFKGKKYKSKFFARISTGSFNSNFKNTRTEADWLTRDNKVIDNYISIANPNRKFTIESYCQMIKGCIYLNKISNIKKSLNIPILLISGKLDPVGENGIGVERVYNMLKKAGIKNIDIKLYDDARHELLNEINKDEIYSFVLDWIER